MGMVHRPVSRARRAGTVVGYAIGALLVAVLAVAVGATVFTRLPGEESTPSGLKRNQAIYLQMRDGVRIAVDVWLPASHARDQRLPVIMQMTRYWRARDVGPLQRMAVGLGLASADQQLPEIVAAFNDAGYAFVKVDARGTGASFGNRLTEFAPDEVRDYGEIASWAAAQPWSSGAIGAVGASYEGNTAELLASTGNAAVRAVAPLFADFDPQYGLVQPGGAPMGYLDRWGQFIGQLDRNALCELAGKKGLECWIARLWSSGVKRVDDDRSGASLRAALVQHRQNADVAASFRSVEFRDDKVAGDLGMLETTPYGLRERIEASGVPMLVWTGWLDAATTDGALSRYLTFSNPQHLVIGAWSHGARHDTDPLAAADLPVEPGRTEQIAQLVTFFNGRLKSNEPLVPSKQIRYFTQGERRWHTTTEWPPADVTMQTLYLGPHFSLTESPPADAEASDEHTVDFGATTGEQSRWLTNQGGGDVVYPDRNGADARLLTYSTPPLAADLVMTGTPIVELYVASTTADAVFHAYLESVAPDGTVRYLTEGVLRAIHRRTASTAPAYVPLGPHRSFLRADASPLLPGQLATVTFALYATSVRVPGGSRLRLAVAGADAPLFQRIPADTDAVWTVFRDSARPSSLQIPVQAPRAD